MVKERLSKAARIAAVGAVLSAGFVPVVHAQNVNDVATSDARDDGTDYGWIGLLGLIGLAGLMRRDRSHATYPQTAAASRT
jgi:MYXO-CTERM domain-containing protein